MRADVQSVDAGTNFGTGQPFANSLEHLLAELERIDLLVQVQVRRARAFHTDNAEFQGLCISEEEVDALLSKPCGLPRWADTTSVPKETAVHAGFAQLRAAIDRRKRASHSGGIRLRLADVACFFNLDESAIDIVLVCLAPEMDLRYEKLYAYLQDDVTKRRPSVDLILNLLTRSYGEKLKFRRQFASRSTLIEHHLIELFADGSQPEPSLLRKYCKLDARIVNFLLGLDVLDERLPYSTALKLTQVRLDEVQLPDAVKEKLSITAIKAKESAQSTTFYFQGPRGTCKRVVAEALCGEIGSALLEVDVKHLLENPNPGFRTGVQLAIREALLQQAMVYWRGFDFLLDGDKTCELHVLLREIAAGPSLSFLAGNTVWEPAEGQLSGVRFFRLEIPALSYAERSLLWDRLLKPEQRGEGVDLTALSSRFRLNTGDMAAAAVTAQNLARWRSPHDSRVTMSDLHAACRFHSNRNLASLARKIDPKYTLDDIVLPPDQLAQLKEILHRAKFRDVVLLDWGFGRKLSLGKGLNALFSGPAGTGKTMAAEVIANELSLDLYQIDLSQVVSKYIGETEKNLNQIFREAFGSNAILLFDEADALFGKRSEVKDAHDRYANIEVAYLLQKMEEYEGIAILATNLRNNVDEAFLRRMHVIVDFPFPDEEYRRRLWKTAFPHEAPVGKDVDFSVLARDVRLAGGNIKNIALAAAFYAASDGNIIRMSHLIQAAQREHQKLGRSWIEGERILHTAKPVG
jgi:AAA+ superfamily predicted ATPase